MYTFIESPVFQRELANYLDDEEFAELQEYLMEHPTAGDVVPGSGGVRKVRWKKRGTGKRGGMRVIYFVRYQPNEFWMLTLYAKTNVENAPAHILRALKESFNA